MSNATLKDPNGIFGLSPDILMTPFPPYLRQPDLANDLQKQKSGGNS